MTLPWMAAKILLRPVAEMRPDAGNARVHMRRRDVASGGLNGPLDRT